MNRRKFLFRAAAAGGGLFPLRSKNGLFRTVSAAIVTSENNRPQIPFGVQSGDVTSDRAIIWSRTDRPARMIVEYSTTEKFQNVQRVVGQAALEPTDYATRVDLTELPAGQKIFYRISFQDLNDHRILSEPVSGSFQTFPNTKR